MGFLGSMAMSDTRPPITAGPIERAFRFLKSASLSDGSDGKGLSVAEGDGASCADKIEIAKLERTKVQQRTIRFMIGYHRVELLQGKHVGWFRGAQATGMIS
jgi:hypothetical protein